MARYFTPALFAFLRQLKDHNTREWFQAHRDRYTADVEAPLLQFIADVAPALRSLSPAVLVDARRTGGSMFRIHRDTRFSHDKSPYKTAVAATFAHEERKARPSVPGFYLHLEPGDCMGGGGIYHPDAATLTTLRLAIVEEPRAWTAVRRGGFDIQGDRLKRAPAGFDPAHPHIEDLKLKDQYTLVPFTQAEVCADGFLDRYAEACARVAPLLAFQARALGLRW